MGHEYNEKVSYSNIHPVWCSREYWFTLAICQRSETDLVILLHINESYYIKYQCKPLLCWKWYQHIGLRFILIVAVSGPQKKTHHQMLMVTTMQFLINMERITCGIESLT
jgi:hypothetical protein